MRAPRLLALCTLLSVIGLPLLAQVQGGYVQPRIIEPVNERQLTTLKGNTHPLARPQYDRGAAPADLRMDRMLLVLKRSPEQETALLKLLDDQQDKGSPNYHKWLTPEQFGQTFGPADADIQAITSWLISRGFQIGNVSKGRTVIEFSGTASQVQQAFHTAIHKYVVKGEEHWANAGDLRIPSALAPVVAGVHTLHDFRKQPTGKFEATRVSATLGKDGVPQVNLSDGSHALVPGDLQTIYNARPLLNVGKNGNTETIAVVGRSNVFNFGEDVSDFRSIFGGAGGPFFITLNGPDPGDLGGGEEGEATLDLTWAAALAPGATVNFVASAGTNTTDGVDLSALYIVDNNLAGIMTESFSICEIALGTTELQDISSLAEQAAAQGITYMVSSGDSGAAGCDSASSSSAQFGKAVNALAATPFTVAVGGTMFNENGHNSTYWNTNNLSDFSSAKSYIPENVWNESGPTLGLWSSGGGVSTFFNKPVWQAGVGVPADGKRDVPDVSLTAAGHDAFIICLEGSCVPDQQTGQFFIFLVSGTSASAPSFAGIMALVDQAMFARQGQANYVMYKLAQGETLSQCNGSSTSGLPNASCIFNDVTVGNNSVPGLTGFSAGVGYDMATGLGSVNINNLVTDWASATFSGTTTALTLNSGNPVNVTHGTAVDVHIVVTPSGSGTPTGDVSLWGPNDAGLTFFALSGGSVTTSTRLLPGGTYTVKSHYQGDATFSQSESSPVAVTVNPENSSTTMQALLFDPLSGHLNPFTSASAGSFIYLRADVAGASGFGTASGNVIFTDNGTDTIAGSPFVLNSDGNTATPNGITTLAAGPHSIVASYSGDGSFHTSTSSAVTFNITDFSVALGSSTINISKPGGSGSTQVTVTAVGGDFNDRISFNCSNLPTLAVCIFTPSAMMGPGTATMAVMTTGPHLAPGSGRATATFGALLLAGVFLVPWRRRRWSQAMCGLVLCVLVLLPACGGGSSGVKNPGTPTGDFTVTMNAVTSNVVHSSTFLLHIQ